VPSIETEFRTFLLAQASITTLVAGRVYAERFPQGTKPQGPAIIYRIAGGDRTYHAGGASGLMQSDIAITCHGKGSLDAHDVYEAIRLKVDGKAGTWGTTAIDHATLSAPSSGTASPILGDEVGFPAVNAVVEVFHAETIPA
jgi:hypothetical protein